MKVWRDIATRSRLLGDAFYVEDIEEKTMVVLEPYLPIEDREFGAINVPDYEFEGTEDGWTPSSWLEMLTVIGYDKGDIERILKLASESKSHEYFGWSKGKLNNGNLEA